VSGEDLHAAISRLAILNAAIDALSRRDELLAVVTASLDDAEAIAALSTPPWNYTLEQSQIVLALRFDQLTARSRQKLIIERDELRRHLGP
jgi:DNA gyrase/topoisomerase IV subunit A